MSSNEVKVVVPAQFEAWVSGFQSMPGDFMRVAEDHWAVAMDLFFDRTQDAIHIVSGDLKASGRSAVRREGNNIVGELTYGGVMGTKGMVDYAMEEEDRGGEHAYISIGWQQAQASFDRAMPMMWEEVIAGWR